MSVIPNSINVGNPIAPNFTDDTFALFDPIYGIGGLREVANLTERDNISAERLRVGMLVYVTSENEFYRLVSSSEDPVSFVTTTNWENVIFLNNSGQTISGVKTFASRPNVNGTGVLLSGEVFSNKVVYTTGNQIISGNKTFLNEISFGNENGTVGYISGTQYFDGDSSLFITAQGAGAQYIYLTANPSSMNIGEGGINIHSNEIKINNTDAIYIYGASEIAATNTSAYLKNVEINTLLNITSISGGRQVGYISGESLDDGDISNLYIKTNGGGEKRVILQAEGHTLTLGRDGGLRYGNNQFVINGNSENLLVQNADVYVEQNAYASNLVYNVGDQTISGNKIFVDNITINNLTVTGTRTIANTQENNINSNYLLLNITGGATNGGIYFVTGAGFSGVNSSGPIIAYDANINKFRIGTGIRSTNINSLKTIAAAEDVVTLAGNQTISGVKTFLDKISLLGEGYISGYAEDGGPGGEGGLLITSPARGGSTEIDIIQGQGSIKLNNDYGININHGSDINLTTAKSSINLRDYEGDIYLNGITTAKTGTFQKLYADNLVYNTGDQVISGVKTFKTGRFDDLTLINELSDAKIKFGRDDWYLSCNGGDPIYTLAGNTPIILDAYNGGIGLNGLFFSVNPYDLATYFGDKGEFVQLGFKDKFIKFYDYNSVLDQVESNTQYNFKSGVSGYIPIDSEVVHITGDETISGQKTFKTRPTVNGTGVLLVGEALSNDTINVKTGNFDQLNTNNLVVTGTATFNNIDLSEIDSVYVSGADVLLNYSGSKFFKITQTGIISNLGVNIGKQNINNSNDTSFIFNDVNNLIQSGVLHSSIINGISNTIESGAKERNNIYGGFSNSITSGNDNIIIGGANNEIFGSNSIVVGGGFNYSSGITQKLFTHFGYLLGDYSSLIGGTSNSIFGGEQNLILGGNINNISKSAPTGINTIVNSWKSNILDSARTNLIIGGAYHASSGDYQTIINGYTNQNYGRYSNIFNGYNNTISGSYSTILNGQTNTIESSNSAVLHGSNNYIYENNGVVIGNKNYIGHSGAVLISDSTSRIKNSQAENSLSLDFTNGVYLENDVSIYNLRLRNRKYTDYNYKTSNFVFSTYMNIVNSSSTINALLPNVEDSRNFFVKNINSGVLNITSTHLIDGQSSLTLYKNESVEFMGIIKNNYTGWIVVGGNGGVN